MWHVMSLLKKLMKVQKGSRVFYDIFVNVNDYIPQNKWQTEIGDISENERKSIFLSTEKNGMKLNFEISNTI